MKKPIQILVLLFATLLYSQAEIIKAIKIVNQKGEEYDMSSVKAFTSFKVGQEVPDVQTIISSIATDVTRMRDTKRFSFVDARMDQDKTGVTLIYTVVNKYKLTSVKIVTIGEKVISDRKVFKASELKINQFADDSTFTQAAIKIKEKYRLQWYPDAKVTWEKKVDKKHGTVSVTFKIVEGSELVIKKIVFKGNNKIVDKGLTMRFLTALVPKFLRGKKKEVTSKDIRKMMKQEQKGFFSFFTNSGRYNPDNVDHDVFSIKSYFMNQGYLDVEVSSPKIEYKKSTDAKLIFTVNEGLQYRVGKISITGMKTFTEKELRPGILLRTGDIAAYRNVEKGSEAIRGYYGNRGYVQTRVKPLFTPHAEKATVDINYHITEGSIGYIRNINIIGTERNKDKVVRRELVVYPGEKFNRGYMKSSENRLRNLNYFSFVSIRPVPTEKSDQYDLNVQVKERETGQFSVGLGLSSIDSISAYVELAQGNFDLTSWPPIGGGQKAKIRATIGTERNDLDVIFKEPWFLNRRLALGVNFYHHESRYFSDDYDQENNGARFSLTKPIPFISFSRATIAYTIENFDVFNVATNASDAIKNEAGDRLKSSLSFPLSRDSRDRFDIPTRGNKTIITPYVAGGILGGETDLYGLRLRSAKYWPLIGDAVFNIRGQIESVDYYGDSDSVPIFDRLFLGGGHTLRGFDYRDVGPRDINNEPVGGQTSVFCTLEYTIPIWNKVRFATFYDIGFVNADPMDFDTSRYNDDAGIGIRIDMRGLPLQVDYAWPITYYDEDGQTGKGRFNFNMGYSF